MSSSSSAPEGLWRLPLALVLGCLLLAYSAVLGIRGWLDAPLNLREAVVMEIPEGGNLTRFVSSLHDRGVLMHPFVLRLQARLDGVANRVRAGEYQLDPGLTARQLLAKLISGEVVQYAITVVEGTTTAAMLDILRVQPKLQKTLRPGASSSLIQELSLQAPVAGSPEGLFFPDTYHFHLGMSDRDLLLLAHRRMHEILEAEWAMRAPDLPYRNSYEALIMASLIERETGRGEERPAIAGVFVRRLQAGMLLQTDPSVIYGLGQEFDGNLTRAHLRQPGPYNTYINSGLPPTPIALPGRAAIHAALHPASGDALYFVARGDGSHQFSAPLDAHNRAVRQFQRGRRQRTADPVQEP